MYGTALAQKEMHGFMTTFTQVINLNRYNTCIFMDLKYMTNHAMLCMILILHHV